MAIFGIIVGALLVLASVVLDVFWVCRYPWPFQGWRTDPIGTFLTGAFGVAMLVGGVYLIFWSIAH